MSRMCTRVTNQTALQAARQCHTKREKEMPLNIKQYVVIYVCRMVCRNFKFTPETSSSECLLEEVKNQIVFALKSCYSSSGSSTKEAALSCTASAVCLCGIQGSMLFRPTVPIDHSS